jgi:hypothetical protein
VLRIGRYPLRDWGYKTVDATLRWRAGGAWPAHNRFRDVVEADMNGVVATTYVTIDFP